MYLIAAIMVRDEQFTILETLRTLDKKVDEVFIMDTGSEDETLQTIRNYNKLSGTPKLTIMNYYQKLGYPFFHYSDARNYMLKMIYQLYFEDDQWIILLDAGDKLYGYPKEHLTNSLPDILSVPVIVHTETIDPGRLFRPSVYGSGWRYEGSVHEVILPPENSDLPLFIPPCDFHGVYITHDRKLDGHRTIKRFALDIPVLKNDMERFLSFNTNRGNFLWARALLHLAHTYLGLENYKQAMQYYYQLVQCNYLKTTDEFANIYARMGWCAENIQDEDDCIAMLFYILSIEMYPHSNDCWGKLQGLLSNSISI